MKKKIVLSENDITNAVREALEEVKGIPSHTSNIYDYMSNPNIRRNFTGEFTNPNMTLYYVCNERVANRFMIDGFAVPDRNGFNQGDGIYGPGYCFLLDKPDENLMRSYGGFYLTVNINGRFPILRYNRANTLIAFVPYDCASSINIVGTRRDQALNNGEMAGNDNGSEWTSTATRPVSLEESIKRALSKAIKKVLNESKK